MAEITWDKSGERLYEVGVDHGVLYPNDSAGVPWNGLISVEEAPTGGETEAYYFDGMKYFDSVANQDFHATVQAFTYPTEFNACEGNVLLANGLMAAYQTRETFGMAWRTKIGNDIDGNDHGYRLHLVYNATAAPSTRSYQTIGESPSPLNFSWEIDAVPVLPGIDLQSDSDPGDWVWPEGYGMAGWPMGPDGNTPVPGWKATSYIMIEEETLDEQTLQTLHNHLYGTYNTPPYLISQFDMMGLLNGAFGEYGVDMPYNYGFDYTDPDDGGGGDEDYNHPLSASADLASAVPFCDWSGPGGEYPPYNLTYPSLNSAGFEYPDPDITVAALVDDSDLSYITLAYAMGEAASGYFYPMPGTQDEEFQAGWPTMPPFEQATIEDHKEYHDGRQYRMEVAFTPPSGGGRPYTFGIRCALTRTGDFPLAQEGFLNPTIYFGDINENQSYPLVDNAFDGEFHDLTFSMVDSDEAPHFTGRINIGWSYIPSSEVLVNPEWSMEMKISKVWLE